MACIQALGELFHLNLAYHKPSNCFVFSIWLAKSHNVASKYRANFAIKGDDSELCYNGIKVISVENTPSIDECIEDTENNFLCLTRNQAKNVSVKKEEGSAIIESLHVDISFEKI